MYVPPYNALKKALEINSGVWSNYPTVVIPESLFKLLLQIVLSASDFDDASYLAMNPDIREALQRGDVSSARLHYVGYGYFEGRSGGSAQIDATWYAQTYPDVTQAIDAGTTEIRSVDEHFHAIGAAEGRSPNPAVVADVQMWLAAVRGR